MQPVRGEHRKQGKALCVPMNDREERQREIKPPQALLAGQPWVDEYDTCALNSLHI